MNTAKRALIKLALVGTMAAGIVGMPLVASAQAELNEGWDNCHGFLLSGTAVYLGGLGTLVDGQDIGPAQRSTQEVCAQYQGQ